MKNFCSSCGESTQHSVVERRSYVSSGLDNVILRDVEVRSCKCGESLILRAAPQLQTIIALCLAYKPVRLRGKEVRFIRSVLRRTGVEFAKALSISPEHLSRIENEVNAAGASLDKLIRLKMLIEMFERREPSLRTLFKNKDIVALIDTELPEDDGSLKLLLTYRGPYTSAVEDPTPLEFEFSKAA